MLSGGGERKKGCRVRPHAGLRRVWLPMIFGLGAGLGLGFTSQASAESITVGTYNIRIAGFGSAFDDWVNMRRHQVFMSIEAKQPDFMGFQEAFARNAGTTQQETLGELFEETKWRFYSWAVENEFNMNPIIVNTDRFAHVAAGTITIDFQDFLTPEEWTDYVDLHTFFHGDDGNVHFLGSERFVNWVVADDLVGGGRIAFLTSHYETFIGINTKGAEFDDDFVIFSDLVNRSFGYASQQIHAQAVLLAGQWGDLEAIIGGDFETPDPTLPSQQEYTDAGYTETWRFINGNGPRPTQGIDNMFVALDGFTINDSYYDQAEYTNGASDHKPLYAVVTQSNSSGSVPAASTWGLVSLTLLLLAAGSMVIQRTTNSSGSAGRSVETGS